MAEAENTFLHPAVGTSNGGNAKMPSLQVVLRMRPMIGTELENKDEELNFSVAASDDKFKVAIKGEAADVPSAATTPRSKRKERMLRRRAKNKHAFSKVDFDYVFTENSKNADVYKACDPLVDHILTGKTSMVFAYGNTGSGKTHTILGYPSDRGLYYMAAEKMCDAVKALNDEDAELKASVQVQFVELYLDNVYDLLNNREDCRIRESEEGSFHFRKFKGKQADGCALDNKICVTVDEIEEVVKVGVENRAMGHSSFHSQSSRSHAVLEMEIVSEEILHIRKKLVQYRSFWIKACNRCKEGLPLLFETKVNSADRNLRMRVKSKYFEDLVWADAEICKQKRFKTHRIAFKWVYDQWKKFHAERLASVRILGGKLVLVDLAGSEHGRDVDRDLQQSAQEKREGKQINLSLMALNEVFRHKALKEKQKFRNATLTKALRDYFQDAECRNLMIATLSSSMEHMKQTVSTLNYASQLAKCT